MITKKNIYIKIIETTNRYENNNKYQLIIYLFLS